MVRAGCGASEKPVAEVRRGDRVDIRFALAGETGMCYKVEVDRGGSAVHGYLPASALTGIEEFDRARRQATPVGGSGPAPAAPSAPAAARSSKQAPYAAKKAAAELLVESKQPKQALEAFQKLLAGAPDDAELLALAGMAAYQSDQPRLAGEYWTKAQSIKPDPRIENLLGRVGKELKSDVSGGQIAGGRFTFRYDGATVSPSQAREISAALDHEYLRVSEQLGCRTGETITAVIQSAEAYRKTTGAAEWSGGQYDGRIRVPLLEGSPGDRTRQVFAHEVVHACLAQTGDWPAWMHEGLAQKLSGETIPLEDRDRAIRMARSGRLPPLDKMGGTFSRMSAANAKIAYAAAYIAADTLYRRHGVDGVRSLIQNPDRLPRVEQEIDRWIREQ